MEILLWFALAALPLGAVLAISGAVVAAVAGLRAPAAVLSALVLVLLVVWVVTTYQSGLRADETGASGSIFATSGWLVGAIAAGVTAALVSLQRRRSSPRAATRAG
jgi:hypothetical protein